MFPLENITPEWKTSNSIESPSNEQGNITPRTRLLGLKELSLGKMRDFKTKLIEAKRSSKNKPSTVNRGVGTHDEEVSSDPDTTPRDEVKPNSKEDSVNDTVDFISTKPERFELYENIIASPQYAKDRYLLSGHNKKDNYILVSEFLNGYFLCLLNC